jgi:hypothetical protein
LGSKRELTRQALTGGAGTQLQVPDAGSVDTDLRMLARAVQVARCAPQGSDHHGAHRRRPVRAGSPGSCGGSGQDGLTRSA